MSGPPVRPGPLARLVTNFWRSLKGRHIDGKATVVGEDVLGNKYYEIPAEPSLGRRRPRRWFTNSASGHQDIRDTTKGFVGFDAEVPAEWDSWLRFRRDTPPTNQQVLQSLALADLKKVIFRRQNMLKS